MTHTEILEKLGTAVKQGLGIDESVLEALEEALLAADVGADTAAALTDAVRGARERLGAQGPRRVRAMLLPRRSRSSWPRRRVRPRPRRRAPLRDLSRRRQRLGQDDDDGEARGPREGGGPQRPARGRRHVPRRRDRAAPDLGRPAGSAGRAAPRGRGSLGRALRRALGARRRGASRTLLVDTAGRLHTKKNLMEELAKMRRVAAREVPGAPHETLLVLDATTGVNGLVQARQASSRRPGRRASS